VMHALLAAAAKPCEIIDAVSDSKKGRESPSVLAL
jgi:hypothetical protein